MNTDYGNNPFANFGSSGSAGVNLEQLFVTGTVAYRLNDSNSIGLGVTWTRQQFEARGVQAFAGMSQDGSRVSNNGKDVSRGWGVKLGVVFVSAVKYNVIPLNDWERKLSYSP